MTSPTRRAASVEAADSRPVLQVNLVDGETLRYDLSDPDEFGAWSLVQADADFQERISGVALLRFGQVHSLPLPQFVKRSTVTYEAGCIGPKDHVVAFIILQASDVRVKIVSYADGKHVRTDVSKPGHQSYSPVRQGR